MMMIVVVSINIIVNITFVFCTKDINDIIMDVEAFRVKRHMRADACFLPIQSSSCRCLCVQRFRLRVLALMIQYFNL